AVLGGCDALSIEGDHPPSLFPRWSRNVSSILREESFFSNIADPLAGAYALDAITNSIAKSAWELFQEKVKTI
ncbi:MAG TPA: methylmalonyl-CoA mutase family protein, partial [Chryseosolibacter sp.]